MRSRPRFRRARVTLRQAEAAASLRVSHLFTSHGTVDLNIFQSRRLRVEGVSHSYVARATIPAPRLQGTQRADPPVPFHRFIQSCFVALFPPIGVSDETSPSRPCVDLALPQISAGSPPNYWELALTDSSKQTALVSSFSTPSWKDLN